MKKKSKTNPSSRLVSHEDCASVIGLPIVFTSRFIESKRFKKFVNFQGKPSISHSDFMLMTHDPKVIAEADLSTRFEIGQRIEDEEFGRNNLFAERMNAKLREYRTQISCLANIHSKYLPFFGPSIKKTPLMAAYLLYARVINLLNMGCASLESGYWNAGLILRQIDETVQLAEYFSCCSGDVKVQLAVTSWFLENRTPEPKDIRTTLAAHHEKTFGTSDATAFLGNMSDLYNKKSKWVHPAFNPIREAVNFTMSGSEISIDGFDYGMCTNPRKLYELTMFYRSSVWTAVQGFVLCFQLQIPIDGEDAQSLYLLDQKFCTEPDGLD